MGYSAPTGCVRLRVQDPAAWDHAADLSPESSSRPHIGVIAAVTPSRPSGATQQMFPDGSPGRPFSPAA
jgi:hypothetical protein